MATGTFTLADLKVLAAQLSTLVLSTSDIKGGRVGSISDEDSIIAAIKALNKYNVREVPKGCWFDVQINGAPVQIKSSRCDRADNFSSKAGVLWAVTNLSEAEILSRTSKSWLNFRNILMAAEAHPGHRDFLILVFNKRTKIFLATSLQSVSVFTPNGSNLPFQIYWGGPNKVAVWHSAAASYELIKNAYLESLEKWKKSH